MARSRPTRQLLARQVWRDLFDLLLRSAPARTRSLAAHGLTPNDSRALFSLEGGTGRSMRSLADEWECEPSYATSIVDRLETLGLASRQVVEHDRRVRMVLLTRKGAKTRADLLEAFHQPPPEFERLEVADLEALSNVLAKLAPGTPARAHRSAV
jgi:DNA-binding MarR family transcriptional regulator